MIFIKFNRKIAALCFAIAVYGVNLQAQTAFMVGGITYEANGDHATVIAHDSGYSGNIIIPDTVENVGIKYAVTAIGENAFFANKSLTSVSIPASVTDIKEFAFIGCDSLENILVADTNLYYLSFNGVLYNKDTTYLIQYPNGKTATSYTIHNSAKVIGKGAFAFNTVLATIRMPDSLLAIEENAFLECTVLAYIDIPDKDTLIGSGAFGGCLALNTIAIGAAVATIGEYVFAGCVSLESIMVDEDNAHYVSIDGVLFTVDTVSLLQYPVGKADASYTIPPQVVTITHDAFRRCHNIEKVYFGGDLLETIDTGAFRECTMLQTLGYTGLPSAVKSIGDHAFNQCISLDTLKLGDGVGLIGEYALYECTALKDIIVDAQNPRYASNNGVLFSKNTDTLFLYPAGKTVTNYSIPAAVTRVENAAFAFCKNLKTLVIGNNMASIGEEAFYLDTGITQITVNATTVPQITNSTFTSVPYNIPVYVACGRENDYRQNPHWSYFTTITPIQDYTFEVSSNNTIWGTVYITQHPSCINQNTAIAEATPVSGYGFSKWDDGNTENPRTIILNADTTIEAQFVMQYNVTVSSSDLIMGEVTGTGTYNDGTVATLQANAWPGYCFTQWNDGNTDNPRQVTVTQDSNFTATFAVGATLQVLTNDPALGTASGGGSYAFGSNIQLTATPIAPNVFTSWNDGNTQNLRTITLTKDSTFTATFSAVYTLTATSVSASQGNVTGGGNYMRGTQIPMTANANSGYRFLRWNDYNTQNPRTITLVSDTVFTASFEKVYTLNTTANYSTRGIIVGGGVYAENALVTLRAYPNEGFVFARWDDGNTDNPRTVTLTRDSSLTAIFSQAYVVLIGTNDPNMGTVNTAPVIFNNTLLGGDTVNLTAIAAPDHRFIGWSDDTITSPARKITITKDTTITANFIALHRLSLTSADLAMGSVSGDGIFDHGNRCTITANANIGYRFLRWTDGNTTNPRIVTLLSDTSFTATFLESCQVTLQVNDTAMGIASGGGSFDMGSNIILKAIPKPAHRFVQWNDGDTTNPRNYQVAARSITFTAQFVETYCVSARAVHDSCGYVEYAEGDSIYDKNATATLEAIPRYGYRFTQWTDGETSNPRLAVITQDTSFKARFTAIHYITIRTGDATRGTVTGSGNYDQGDTAVMAASAFTGYRFARWNDGDTTNPRKALVEQSKLYTALFAKIQHLTVLVNDAAMGTALGSGEYDQDSIAVMEAIPNKGFRFLKWNDENSDNPRKVLIKDDTTFTAVFINLFKVEGISNDTSMGTVVGGGFYDRDEVAVLTAIPQSGYRFVAWEDGEEQNPYSIVVTENKTLKAIFELKPVTPGDPTGIKEREDDPLLKIYPNPVENGQLIIEYRDTHPNLQAEIYTVQGTMVGRYSIKEKKTIIEVLHLVNGTYFIKMGTIVKKIIIHNK